MSPVTRKINSVKIISIIGGILGVIYTLYLIIAHIQDDIKKNRDNYINQIQNRNEYRAKIEARFQNLELRVLTIENDKKKHH
jgi:hypothetical protein